MFIRLQHVKDYYYIKILANGRHLLFFLLFHDFVSIILDIVRNLPRP